MRRSRKTAIKRVRESRVLVELCAPHLGYGSDMTKQRNLNGEGGCRGLHAKGPRKELSAPFPGLGVERNAERRKGGVPFRGSRGRERGRRDREERECLELIKEKGRPSLVGQFFGPSFGFEPFFFLGRFASCHISITWVKLFSTVLDRIIFQSLLFNYYH